MLLGLAEAIETVEIAVESASIAAGYELVGRLHAKVTTAAGAFDANCLWDLDAATSMTAWLTEHAGLSPKAAAGEARRGKRLHRFPVTTAAVIDGDLTGGQLDAILANVPAKHLDTWALHETEVIPTLVGLTLEDTVQAMHQWRLQVEHDDEPPEEPERHLYWSRTLDGRGDQRGSYPAEAAAIIDTALALATTRDCEGDPPRTAAERRADAEIDIHRFYLDNQHAKTGGRHRPHLNVIIDLDALEHRGQGQFLDGVVIDEPSMERCSYVLSRGSGGAGRPVMGHSWRASSY